MIDLRSDTLTMPTPQMLATVLEAAMGDDGRAGEDGRGESYCQIWCMGPSGGAPV